MRTQVILFALLLSTCLFVDSFAQEMPLVYEVENTGADWPAPYMLSIGDLPTITSLPDPFEWSDGRGRIANLSDWRYRRAEIKAEIEHYEIGEKPGHPDSITASYANDTLKVNITVKGNTLTLTSRVTLPSGAGPFPAVIGIGFGTGSLPANIFTSRGIAQIPFNFSQVMAHTQNRGSEPINKLYPELTYIGAYSAWSWGISRLIDGLELVASDLKIDLKHLAVTGCSFAGKMALFAGAFDERIALTIAQESGGGGYTTWRVSETLGNVETLGRTSHAWFIEDLFQFANAVPKLPYDHHELMAMVAPRALLVTGNPDYEWLADESGHVGSKAAKEVWKALGVPDRFGFSIISGHAHCAVPSSQIPEIEAFVEKFLLGNTSVNTDISTSPYNTDLTRWITWTTPALSNGSSFLERASLIHPAANQTQLDTVVTFEWKPVASAAKYYFQLSTSPTFKATVVNDSLSETTRTVTGLSYAKKYYWRVQVRNSEGSLGPWSELRSFATFITLPGKTQLVSATPYAGGANLVNFKWRRVVNATEYSIQVSDEPGFARVLLSATTSDTVTDLRGTVEGQKYYWRVAAGNIGGLGPWSDVWNFTIILKPTGLKLQRTGLNEITLTWRDNSNVEDGYVIERKLSAETSFAVIDTLKGSGDKYVDKNVQQGQTYVYRIKAYKDSAESGYSNEASIFVTGIQEEESGEIPTEYSMSQNYPNPFGRSPFNPATAIRFALPKATPTKITIHDLLGKEIMTLVNDKLPAGFHKIELDLGNLPSGVYLYRIQSGEFIQSKKMILLQ
ncbi:MAG: T9SS type A sorting domain-containing protein [candidate division KSB1 bacterium]|nr:T9SS type A sorting domain-containing protein [candidate division KSB1 bacterium]